ncbi:MAG TPA: hypothetical protein VHO01_02725 [Jatrophihabitans sp.]|nr:hypothetical protein [Jatrophihabitans sp.]
MLPPLLAMPLLPLDTAPELLPPELFELPRPDEPESPVPVLVEPVPVLVEPVPVLVEPVPVLVEPVPVLVEPVPVLVEPVLACAACSTKKPRLTALAAATRPLTSLMPGVMPLLFMNSTMAAGFL